jgi:hypothetical protein
MRSFICAALVAASLAPTAAMAQQVDEDFGKGPGTHPVAAILLFPIYAAARAQAAMQPEKDSCWNEGSTEVAFCHAAERYDAAVEVIQSRPKPTPYGM